MAVDLMVQPCLPRRFRGWQNIHLVREKIVEERKVQVLLIGCDLSSLVIDTLCRQAVKGNSGVACFYFDFAT